MIIRNNDNFLYLIINNIYYFYKQKCHKYNLFKSNNQNLQIAPHWQMTTPITNSKINN